jgi:PadR family transcriptional regulator, regulatory protein AphA
LAEWYHQLTRNFDAVSLGYSHFKFELTNQIYGSLIALHKEEAVSIEVQQQEKLPAKKLYTITDKGRAELRTWLLSEPELPVFRSIAHIQLAWAECLTDEELDGLLSAYERQLENQAIMCRETMRRGGKEPARSDRERLIWRSIDENQVAFYENELSWAKSLRSRLRELSWKRSSLSRFTNPSRRA